MTVCSGLGPVNDFNINLTTISSVIARDDLCKWVRQGSKPIQQGLVMIQVGLIYLFLIGAAYLLLSLKNFDKCRKSFKQAGISLFRLLPMLLAIFGLVGLFQEYLSPELIGQWLGEANGLWGLLLATLAGAIAIGPPLAAYPLADSLLSAGAWPPVIAAFIVSWITVGVVTLPFEIQVFGRRFALVRNSLCFVSAILCGLLLGVLL